MAGNKHLQPKKWYFWLLDCKGLSIVTFDLHMSKLLKIEHHQ